MKLPSFRPMIAALARRFPPKHASERVLPWAALVAGVVGAAAALWQYGNDLAIERSQTTLEMHKQFRTSHGNWSDTMLLDNAGQTLSGERLAMQVVKIRCQTYAEALADGRLEIGDRAVPDCNDPQAYDWALFDWISLNGGDALRDDIRRRVAAHMASNVRIRPTRFFEVARFLRALVICVDRGNCDSETTIALFGKEMSGFLNMSCGFADPLGPEARSEIQFLADYLIAENFVSHVRESGDPGRQKVFFCDFLREGEPAAVSGPG